MGCLIWLLGNLRMTATTNAWIPPTATTTTAESFCTGRLLLLQSGGNQICHGKTNFINDR
jgi:hypothetical protein